MHYLDQRREAYRHPESILEGVASVVMLGYRYRTARPPESPPGFGRVSRYAWGESDYHDVIRGKLKQLKAWLLRQVPDARVRGVVDTAPLLERDFARMAGLGWIGKHTLLIDPREGSWLFLAALLTDHELLADAPFATDHCGTCRACLDACPTDAFPEPYVLDARRCISYLTIELQDDIPEQLREGVGDWAFGCDICQDVCPWNRKSPVSEEPRFEPREDLYPLELATLFSLDDEAFRQRFGKTPLWKGASPRAVTQRRDCPRQPTLRQRDSGARARSERPRTDGAKRRRLGASTDPRRGCRFVGSARKRSPCPAAA